MEPHKVIEVKKGDISHWELIYFEGKTVWSSEFPKKSPETPTDNDILNELEEPLVEDTIRVFPYSGKDEDWKDGFFEGAKWMRDELTQSHREEMVKFAEWVQKQLKNTQTRGLLQMTPPEEIIEQFNNTKS